MLCDCGHKCVRGHVDVYERIGRCMCFCEPEGLCIHACVVWLCVHCSYVNGYYVYAPIMYTTVFIKTMSSHEPMYICVYYIG